MLLYEFDQELEEETYSQYTRRLIRTLKIKQLGQGAIADVFQHPADKNVAVKIMHTPDPQYMNYIKFCQAHPDNKYLPKVIDVVKTHVDSKYFHGTTDRLVVVFLQRVKPLSATAISNAAKQIVNAYCRGKNEPKEPLGGARWEFDDISYRDWVKICNQKEDPDLAEFARLIVSKFNRADLHNGNVMSNGHNVVFTDPFI